MDGFLSFPCTVIHYSDDSARTGTDQCYHRHRYRQYSKLCPCGRGEVHIVKNEEYCNACRVIGVSNTRLLFTHILPNAISPIIVYATLNVASAIISEAALSFLGLGIAAPTASWGSILREGKSSLTTAPFVATISGAFILITVLGFNLFGDGIRDVLDPKMKQ